MISPLYGQLSPLRVPTKSGRSTASDADAEAYLLAVEAADGQQLEQTVGDAIDAFVVGCKSDGIWSALKCSCLLAGARTLSGALVPLAGTAPTNANFVAGDYDRKTGLKGDGTNKSLNSNRNNNADPQNSKHISVYVTQTSSVTTTRYYMGAASGTGSSSLLVNSLTVIRYFINSIAGVNQSVNTVGLIGGSRNNSTNFTVRGNGASATFSGNSQSLLNDNIRVFTNAAGLGFSNGRIAFYSIGESIDLAKLDTRVSTLMTNLSTAIA
jgi:hypothetical protein